MKYIFLLLMISTIGYSQEVEDIIKTKKYVLEANKVTDEEGKIKTTIRRQCFILIDSTSIIIQWVSEFDNNGLGGITIAGDLTSYEQTVNSNDKETLHTITISCEMDRGRVNSELVLEIYSRSHAEAELKNSSNSIFVPDEMKFLGKLVPLASSKVVIGAH
jgi:hypothetical protein